MTLSPHFSTSCAPGPRCPALVGRSDQAAAGRARVEGVLPVPQGEDAELHVNDEKGFYHCFGCGAHGDAIRWLTDAARARLHGRGQGAGRRGRDGGARARSARAGARPSGPPGLYEVMGRPPRWFAEQLDGLEGARGARLSRRRAASREATRRGSASASPPIRARKLKTALNAVRQRQAGRGRPADRARGGEREPYDRFRGRLMFPIRDPRGRVHRLRRPHPRRRASPNI